MVSVILKLSRESNLVLVYGLSQYNRTTILFSFSPHSFSYYVSLFSLIFFLCLFLPISLSLYHFLPPSLLSFIISVLSPSLPLCLFLFPPSSSLLIYLFLSPSLVSPLSPSIYLYIFKQPGIYPPSFIPHILIHCLSYCLLFFYSLSFNNSQSTPVYCYHCYYYYYIVF